MTFPRDEEPVADAASNQAGSESPNLFAAEAREANSTSSSQGDLWSPDPGMTSAHADSPSSLASDEQGTADSFAHELPYGPGDTRNRRRKRYRHLAWEITQTLILAVLIFLLVRTVAQNFRVEGPSMEPGLHDGQFLLVNKAVYFKLPIGDIAKFIPFLDAEGGEETFLFHGPQRGDVIVFRYPLDPDRDFIKRIIGVPGDRVRVVEGIVYVNDVALDEDYITDRPGRDLEEERVVPPENYFVLGDNRANSSDSRRWGFVPEENIIGKALLSYWPLEELGGAGNRSLDLGVIRLPLP